MSKSSVFFSSSYLRFSWWASLQQSRRSAGVEVSCSKENPSSLCVFRFSLATQWTCLMSTGERYPELVSTRKQQKKKLTCIPWVQHFFFFFRSTVYQGKKIPSKMKTSVGEKEKINLPKCPLFHRPQCTAVTLWRYPSFLVSSHPAAVLTAHSRGCSSNEASPPKIHHPLN